MQEKHVPTHKVIVTGATSLIGYFLLPKLESENYSVYPFTRSLEISKERSWYQFDGNSFATSEPDISDIDTLIHLGPLKSLPNLIEEFADMGGKRIIAFSSTSRFSKLNSGNESERQLANELISAEKIVKQKCERLNIDWTIFRPTLIYGAGLDKNVSTISRFIRHFNFFPIVGDGSGLRQPVHALDLATACALIIQNKKTFGSFYDLIGGETLTYKEMVIKIFISMNKNVRIISIPLPLFRFAMKCASYLPPYSHITPDMANRMNEPLCFDSSEAKHDFNYKNRLFLPQQSDLNTQANLTSSNS